MKNLLLLILLIPTLLLAQGPGPCIHTLININLDQYPEETSWDIIVPNNKINEVKKFIKDNT